MQRIVVVGSTGSGKTTLGKKLAEAYGLKFIDLDELHHLPGWLERSSEEFSALLDEATQGDKWVVAGNYTTISRKIAWLRADTMIWLDVPFLSCFYQLLKRTISRSITGELICNGNRENLARQFFTTDSILWWFFKSWRKVYNQYMQVFDQPLQYPHLRLIRLRSYRESREFVAGAKVAEKG
jgi:adenylate kinase family enzyme